MLWPRRFAAPNLPRHFGSCIVAWDWSVLLGGIVANGWENQAARRGLHEDVAFLSVFGDIETLAFRHGFDP